MNKDEYLCVENTEDLTEGTIYSVKFNLIWAYIQFSSGSMAVPMEQWRKYKRYLVRLADYNEEDQVFMRLSRRLP